LWLRLPFNDEEYDVIWSEGAIYNIGFEKGVKDWKRFLKTGGMMVVSEITWLTAERPSELQEYWKNEYPEIDTASSKIEFWKITAIPRLPTLFYRSIAGWIIIIDLCRTVLKRF
jgi:ubiquinone/menaquinone biosynthesis C-methylase UbiE